jgi:hypothetical protein
MASISMLREVSAQTTCLLALDTSEILDGCAQSSAQSASTWIQIPPLQRPVEDGSLEIAQME